MASYILSLYNEHNTLLPKAPGLVALPYEPLKDAHKNSYCEQTFYLLLPPKCAIPYPSFACDENREKSVSIPHTNCKSAEHVPFSTVASKSVWTQLGMTTPTYLNWCAELCGELFTFN